jgi:hypothetical protein
MGLRPEERGHTAVSWHTAQRKVPKAQKYYNFSEQQHSATVQFCVYNDTSYMSCVLHLHHQIDLIQWTGNNINGRFFMIACAVHFDIQL